jgi:hypothetical protein
VVVPPVTTEKIYTWDATAEGWTSAIDWVRSSTFTKLGGVYGGSGASWVTQQPTNIATYTEGAYANTQGYPAVYPGANILTSPFIDISGMSGDSVWVSFSHSLETEPNWDRSWLEYTTDGASWNRLGVLNDPKGVNWYSTVVYANSATDIDNFDVGTAALYGLVNPDSAPGWTSNGDAAVIGLPTGPYGWVYNQLKIDPTNYPGIVHAIAISFRYIAFSDAASHPGGGWAFDNFRVGNTAPTLAASTISGIVFRDANGNSVNDAEAAEVGLKVYKSYFGVLLDSMVTTGTGSYSFGVTLPGVYQIKVVKPTFSFTVPGPTGVATLTYPGDGLPIVQDFGTYQGSISGTKYNDLNDDGINNDAAGGYAGFTIEVHKDSCNGALYNTGVTGAGGAYTIAAGPGTYYLKEILLPGYRQTSGACQVVVVSGLSGSGTANPTGADMGNFKLAILKLFLGIDLNGNGVYDGGPDNFALPGGAKEAFEFKKNGVHVAYDTLGNGIDFVIYDDLDTASYTVDIHGTPPTGWARTLDFGGTYSFTVATSGQNPQPHFLDFKAPRVTGVKYNDLNGNGVRDGGDTVLTGWKIDLTGTGGGSATTDTAGSYTFLGVGAGAHTLSEVVQAGWTATQPASGSYALTIISAGLSPGDTAVVRDFGNFKQFSISGMKFRDRNGNGTKDPGDNGMAGWTINATNGGGAQVTDGSGNYTYANLGPGTFVLTETAQAGWFQTAPVGGSHTVVGASGVDVTDKDFGNYQLGDSVRYRTWTYGELKPETEKKLVKAPKINKPTIAPPNSANLIYDLIVTKGAVLQVGLSGQMTSGGKEKGWLGPVKQGDVFASFNSKSVTHVGNPRPLSFFNDGIKRIMKKVKSLPSGKANNVLMANLLTFKINLAASAKGQTDLAQNLGSLIYCEAGHPGLTGMSLNAIAALADSEMTNWDSRGLPGFVAPMWTDLNGVIAQVNAAFSTGSTGDTALATDVGGSGGWRSPKLRWRVVATAQSTSFLCAPGPGISPSSIPPVLTDNAPPAIPTVYGLSQNYPNPFNPTTLISFDLPEASLVTLTVYNMLGQEVMTLLNAESFEAGAENEVEFDASALTSGVYFYRIAAQGIDDDGITTGNTYAKTMKMILVK